MKNRWKKLAAIAVSCVMASTMAIGFTACDNDDKQGYDIEQKANTGWEDEKVYTYHDYSTTIPSRWNVVSSTDGAERDIYLYMQSSFFEFDFKFDENGEILPGEYDVEYSAATKLEDVTAEYKGQYGIAADDTVGHRAWKITLRNDLKWDDGTAIKAEDFVFTMQQQLSPNYLFETAANYWSGNFILHNAKEYYYQGQSVWLDNTVINSEDSPEATLGIEQLVKDGDKYSLGGLDVRISLGGKLTWCNGNSLAAYVNAYGDTYFNMEHWEDLLALADEEGYVPVTDQSIAYLESVIATESWGETRDNIVNYMEVYTAYPEMDFSEVGIFAPSDYEIVIVYDNSNRNPLNADGSLTFEAAYYFQDLPLVKKDLWQRLEDSSKKPYVNTYNSVSVANSASWGPYKLTNFQAATTYTLSRNTNWYGYGLEKYKNQYQTDNIEVRQIADWNTAWLAFQQGGLNAIGIDVSIAETYRNSERAYFTPTAGTSMLFTQCNPGALTKEKGNALLKYEDFRKAFSLSIDRDDYCQKVTTSGTKALGIYNDLIYYDVAHGGVYRHETPAKEALLATYGATKNNDGKWVVNGRTYNDVDSALAAISGYNLTLARELYTKAYNEALAAGDIDANGKVTITYGASVDNSNTQRVVNFLNNAFQESVKGTPLEGRVEVKMFLMDDTKWIDEFRKDGKFDLAAAYIDGGAWDPYYSFQIFVLDNQRLTLGWNTNSTAEKDMITLTVPAGGADQPEVTATLTIVDWFNSLNGLDGGTYNFNQYPTNSKLIISAALERAILESYTTIPLNNMNSAALMSYRCEYITYEYNTFMSYGGIQYMRYNFDDTEWQKFVSDNGGTLDYKY